MQNKISNSTNYNLVPMKITKNNSRSELASDQNQKKQTQTNLDLKQLTTAGVICTKINLLPEQTINDSINELYNAINNATKVIQSYNLGVVSFTSERAIPEIAQFTSVATEISGQLLNQLDLLQEDILNCDENSGIRLLNNSLQLSDRSYEFHQLLNDSNINFNSHGINQVNFKELEPRIKVSQQRVNEFYNLVLNSSETEKLADSSDISIDAKNINIFKDNIAENLNKNNGYQNNDNKNKAPDLITPQVTFSNNIVQYIPGKTNISVMLLTVSIAIAQINYDSASIQASYIDILNDTLGCVTGLSSFLTTLNNFYLLCIQGLNNQKKDDEAAIPAVDFNSEEVYKICNNHDEDLNYKVTRSNGKNTLYLDENQVPEELQQFCALSSDGQLMITSYSIQQSVDYTSKMTAKIVPGCSGDNDINNIYGDAALHSSQIENFMGGLTTTIETQINQTMSNWTSDVETFANQADSALKFFQDFLNGMSSINQQIF